MWVLIQEGGVMTAEELTRLGRSAGFLFTHLTVHGLADPGPVDIQDNPAFPPEDQDEKAFVSISDRLPPVPPLDF